MKIKDKLKSNVKIVKVYSYIIDKYVTTLTKISPVQSSKYLYKSSMGKKLNLKHPKTYNEKLMWLKLYLRNPLKSVCADKYAVRDYIKERNEEECLNELYNVYNSVEDINWEELPEKFVLKVNNTCGANIICNDKQKISKEETLKKLKRWMKDKYYLRYAEIHYKDIEPKIICEKYLETDAGILPIDYKIYCFNGKPKVIMICTERESGKPKYYLCDLDGDILPFNKTGVMSIENGISKIELPKVTKEMYRISENLSKPFPFVRVDFYDYNGKVIFGEMTFTPAGCLDNNILPIGEKIMGEWIELPK